MPPPVSEARNETAETDGVIIILPRVVVGPGNNSGVSNAKWMTSTLRDGWVGPKADIFADG